MKGIDRQICSSIYDTSEDRSNHSLYQHRVESVKNIKSLKQREALKKPLTSCKDRWDKTEKESVSLTDNLS